jgi:hypothetical protein
VSSKAACARAHRPAPVGAEAWVSPGEELQDAAGGAPNLLPLCYQPRRNQAQQRRYCSPSLSGDSPSFVVLGSSWWWLAPSPVRATNLWLCNHATLRDPPSAAGVLIARVPGR